MVAPKSPLAWWSFSALFARRTACRYSAWLRNLAVCTSPYWGWPAASQAR